MSKSKAVASLTPARGITTSFMWFVCKEMRLMSMRRVKRRKASGTMHILPSCVSSRPMGQAHTYSWGYGRFRHKWLHPPLFNPQPFAEIHINVLKFGGSCFSRDQRSCFKNHLKVFFHVIIFFYKI